jgi:hypothetical protein
VTVKELMKKLVNCDPDLEIRKQDNETNEWTPIETATVIQPQPSDYSGTGPFLGLD